MRGFATITKVEEETRTVYAVMASETPDRDNEICDYDSSAPLIREWSSEMYKASGGKSFGNVRAMHNRQLIAAGKVTQIECDDEAKCVNVALKIVDDQEWAKVQEGLYTGVSLGGKCKRRWQDPVHKNLTRYTVKPFEITLADYPANPDSTFQIVKMTGAVEEHHFSEEVIEKSSGEARDYHGRWTSMGEISQHSKKMARQYGRHGLASHHRELAEHHEHMARFMDRRDPGEAVEHQAAAELHRKAESHYLNVAGKYEDAHHAVGFEKKQRAVDSADNASLRALSVGSAADSASERLNVDVSKIAKRDDVSPEEGEHQYGDVEYADEKNKKYPIDTEKHIRAAWNYIHKRKNAGKYSAEDVAAIKGKIAAAWKKHINPEGPPSLEKVLKAAGTQLNDMYKGMFTVSMFANLLDQLDSIQRNIEIEEEIELDGSLVPEQLAMLLKDLAELLEEYTSEEVGELLARLFEDDQPKESSMKIKLAGAGEPVEKTPDEVNKIIGDLNSDVTKLTQENTDLKASNEELTKLNGELNDSLKQATEEITKMQSVLRPGAKALDVSGLHVVTKTTDGGGTDDPAKTAKEEEIRKYGGDPDKDPKAAIRKSHDQGGVVIGDSGAPRVRLSTGQR